MQDDENMIQRLQLTCVIILHSREMLFQRLWWRVLLSVVSLALRLPQGHKLQLLRRLLICSTMERKNVLQYYLCFICVYEYLIHCFLFSLHFSHVNWHLVFFLEQILPFRNTWKSSEASRFLYILQFMGPAKDDVCKTL